MKGLADGAGVDGTATAKGKHGTVGQRRAVLPCRSWRRYFAEELCEAGAKRNQANSRRIWSGE